MSPFSLRFLSAILPLAAVLACTDSTTPVTPPTGTSDPTFARPFASDVGVGNVFDHDLPFPFTDTHDGLLAYWGERLFGVAGHGGWDWPMPVGTPLLAVAAGRVVGAGAESPWYCPPLNATVSGQGVTLEHSTPGGRTVRSIYAHLSRVDVTVGQTVTQGQQIGLSGNTGCSTAPHLHFGAQIVQPSSGNAVLADPYGWSGDGTDPWAQDARGTASVDLWLSGQAPAVFAEFTFSVVSGNFPVAITTLRYLGGGDLTDPNREFFDLALNASAALAVSGSYDLANLQMRTDSVSVAFPAGTVLNASRPTVRVYSGTGANTSSAIHLGRSTPLWPNRQGCARLTFGTTSYIQYKYGDTGWWYLAYYGAPSAVCPAIGAGARLVGTRPLDAVPPPR